MICTHLIAESIVSAVATFSINTNAAALMAGIKIRLTTKLRELLTTNGNLPIFCETPIMLLTVSSEVSGDCTTSMSFITGAGLKKCIQSAHEYGSW
jgi:hypothetical protein